MLVPRKITTPKNESDKKSVNLGKLVVLSRI